MFDAGPDRDGIHAIMVSRLCSSTSQGVQKLHGATGSLCAWQRECLLIIPAARENSTGGEKSLIPCIHEKAGSC